jgi:CRISPR-associated protein Cas2
MIILDVENVPSKIRGILSRRLLEIRAGLFVGSLSKRATEQLWEDVVAENPPAALLVYPAKNELGIEIIAIGKHQYEVSDNYGIPLVIFNKKGGVKVNDM